MRIAFPAVTASTLALTIFAASPATAASDYLRCDGQSKGMGVAEGLAREITVALDVPTIGIGASAGCDGQILVTDDMLGLFDWTPKFVRRYGDLRAEIGKSVAAYAEDVRQRRFPGPAEIYFAKAG